MSIREMALYPADLPWYLESAKQCQWHGTTKGFEGQCAHIWNPRSTWILRVAVGRVSSFSKQHQREVFSYSIYLSFHLAFMLSFDDYQTVVSVHTLREPLRLSGKGRQAPVCPERGHTTDSQGLDTVQSRNLPIDRPLRTFRLCSRSGD